MRTAATGEGMTDRGAPGSGVAKVVDGPGFRRVPADAAYVRLAGEAVQLTFLSDDREIAGESYWLSADGETVHFDEPVDGGPVRVREAAVRMPVPAAAALAVAILAAIGERDPAALRRLGVEFADGPEDGAPPGAGHLA